MSGIFGYSREAVRVKVKKCEGNQAAEFRKFSVDPQITSFEVLESILAKAFDLKGDFTICYRVYDVNGHETYMPLLSDWELDAAFLKAYNLSVANSCEPCLCLRVDLKPFEECSDDWEMKQNISILSQIRIATSQEAKPSPRLHGIFNQMGKTLNMVQRAFNFGDDCSNSLQPPRPPLSDSEFRSFLDPVGQIVYAKELRSVIYFGGIDPSLRKVVWKHLLNVYPDGMTGRERMDYIKKKAMEYVNLREVWKNAIAQGPVVGELAYTTGMVRKDVLRTDRHHPFYAGSDDNQNIASLFNILTTYALNHPKVSYCQGMSDLASPLLVTMNDEAHAYICFCALMQRLCTNFMIDGIAMTQKFTHLAEGLMYYDSEFYNYLKMHQADDLLFCYRWLLLEMKREFAFEDSLRMLEVLWSSLPSDPPEKELKLYDIQFQAIPINSTPPISPLIKTPRENAYTKVCALRRQSSSISLSNYQGKKIDSVKRQNHSLDETISKYRNNIIDFKLKHQSLDDAILINNQNLNNKLIINNKSNETSPVSSIESKSPVKSIELLRPRSVSPLEIKSDSILLNNNNNNNKRLNKKSVINSKKKSSTSLSSSMTNLLLKNSTKKSGHFKELKERLITTKLFSSSLDRLDSSITTATTTTTTIKEENELIKPNKIKMVKNFNEFLNFSIKNKVSDQFTNHEINNDSDNKPKILLTKSSFDESESLSFDQKPLSNNTTTTTNTNDDSTFDEEYSPDDSQEYFPLTTSVTREVRLHLQNLDRKVFGDKYIEHLSDQSLSSSDDSVGDGNSNNKNIRRENDNKLDNNELLEFNLDEINSCKQILDKNDIFVWENPLHQTSPNLIKTNYMATPDEQADIDYDVEVPTLINETSKTVTPIQIINSTNLTKSNNVITTNIVNPHKDSNELFNDNIIMNGSEALIPTTTTMTNSCEEVTEINLKSSVQLLPPPNEFGGGNPFLMFLCITVLLQHRDHIITMGMDYNEMAMHFDKMVRKHNVIKVLNQARQMYARYIKQHTIAQQKLLQDSKREDC